jgi:hypothetical protein
MSELLPCPFCGNTEIKVVRVQRTRYGCNCENIECDIISDPNVKTPAAAIEHWNSRHSKYPLAPVSSTLDRLLNSRFDMAAGAEADLGEIEHKGEKVMVKLLVVRGE